MDFGSLTGLVSVKPFLGAQGLSSWFPEAASEHAGGVDGAFLGILAAAAFAVVLVVGLAMTFIRRFSRSDDTETGVDTGRLSYPLMGVFVLGAVALAGFSFYVGMDGFLDRTVAPYGAYEIDVTARQWDWDFTYPNGYVADTLHVAVGQPVKLVLKTEDVTHGLSVPAMRLSKTVLPGLDAETWFEATVADTFTLRSNRYSGEGYSTMQTALIAHGDGDFQAWLTAVSDIFAGRTLEEVGELLYSTKGCKACHSLDGSKLVGPSFKDVYGNTFDTREGVQVTVDDAYVKESILAPNVSVIAGYEPVMTPYEGNITDREIEAITAWLKTLSVHTPADAAGQEEN